MGQDRKSIQFVFLISLFYLPYISLVCGIFMTTSKKESILLDVCCQFSFSEPEKGYFGITPKKVYFKTYTPKFGSSCIKVRNAT
jgi:hypothetical protein